MCSPPHPKGKKERGAACGRTPRQALSFLFCRRRRLVLAEPCDFREAPRDWCVILDNSLPLSYTRNRRNYINGRRVRGKGQKVTCRSEFQKRPATTNVFIIAIPTLSNYHSYLQVSLLLHLARRHDVKQSGPMQSMSSSKKTPPAATSLRRSSTRAYGPSFTTASLMPSARRIFLSCRALSRSSLVSLRAALKFIQARRSGNASLSTMVQVS